MRSKIAKRIISSALVTLMTFNMAGCGNEATDEGNVTGGSTDTSAKVEQGSASPEATEAPEEVSPYPVMTDENGNVYDLGGMEVIIRDWWSSGEEEEPVNTYEEDRLEYLDWAQETYNFTIKRLAVSDWASTPEDYANYASTTGDENNYVFTVWQGSALIAAMNSGLMYDLSALDCLDFSEDKWKSGVHELMASGDAIYGMSAFDPEPRTGVYFNKRILEDAGINPQDLYTWQENNEWTWEKFEEVCATVHRDTNNDGAIDVYAMLQQRASLYQAAVFSNGGEFIGKNEDGTYYNDLESNETLEALNWSVDMLNAYEAPVPEGANWDYYVTAFVNGETAFCVDDAYRGNNEMATMEDDWGFVCFPMGPNASDYTNVYTDNVYVIPSCYDEERAWKIAFAYNIYTEPIPGYEDYAGWKSSYLNNFRDIESVDLTLERMTKNGMVTYHGMVNNLNLGSDILWSLGYADAEGRVATPAQAAEALRNTWQAYLDETNK